MADRMPERRQKAIAEHLLDKGSVSVGELCDLFDVSEMTIRRDLGALEEAGMLRRTYGGATLNQAAFYQMSFMAKTARFQAEKNRIGEYAANLVQNGDVVLLDSGSTCLAIAKHLKEKWVQVITNAPPIAAELVDCERIEVFLTGGQISKGTLRLIGPHADSFFANVHCDKLFLAVEGVDLSAGFTVPDISEAHTKRLMVNASREIIVVTDHSKIGRNAMGTIIPISGANRLITSKGAPGKIIQDISSFVEVVVV